MANGVKWREGGGVGGCLKRGAKTSLQTMLSVFTLYFKFLRCLKIYQIAAASFSSQLLMYSLKHPHPHPLNDQDLQSITRIFCCYTLLNYKNESSTNVSKYYRLAISCKYKTFLWKEYFVVFQDSIIFGKYTVYFGQSNPSQDPKIRSSSGG